MAVRDSDVCFQGYSGHPVLIAERPLMTRCGSLTRHLAAAHKVAALINDVVDCLYRPEGEADETTRVHRIGR